jgi:hypothetical protein
MGNHWQRPEWLNESPCYFPARRSVKRMATQALSGFRVVLLVVVIPFLENEEEDEDEYCCR